MEHDWTRVTDRLPPEGTVVLTFCGPYIRTAEILYMDEDGIRWLDGGCVLKHVTHWMPLPEAPS